MASTTAEAPTRDDGAVPARGGIGGDGASTRGVEDRGLTRVRRCSRRRSSSPRRPRDHRAVARLPRPPAAPIAIPASATSGATKTGDRDVDHAGDYCAREDLTEFISLLAMALTVPPRWTRGAVDPDDVVAGEPAPTAGDWTRRRGRRAIPHRDRREIGRGPRFVHPRLTHEQLSIVSADVKKDEALSVRSRSPARIRRRPCWST